MPHEKFLPEFHARMNWFCEFKQGHEDANMFAPESVLTRDGRRVMWAWTRVKERLQGVPLQSSIQSLPRELSLPANGILRVKPLRELETLRYDEKNEANLTLKNGTKYRLREIFGDTIEIKIVFEPGAAHQFGVEVHCDEDNRHGFPITFEPGSGTLLMGDTKVKVPLALEEGEPLELRVFLDKSLVEIFANDRQAALAPHRYPPGNVGVCLFTRGADLRVSEVTGWKMKSIYARATP